MIIVSDLSNSLATIRRPFYIAFLTFVLVLGGQDPSPNVTGRTEPQSDSGAVPQQTPRQAADPSVSIKLSKDFQPLLTEDLKHWDVWTGVPHKSVKVPGRPASTSDDGKTGTPIGLSDPLKVFLVEIVDGEPVLRVSGEVYAGLTSRQEFENYHLSLEYKWGKKKFPPREKKLRDSGLLFHCTGEHGKFWNVWMRCLECQIQETDTGDLYLLGGTSAQVKLGGNVDIGKPQYSPAGEGTAVGAGTKRYGCKRGDLHENGDWERVDIFTVGTSSVFAVNGHVVMRVDNAKNGNQSSGLPLSKGKLQIQSEAAEISYRRVKIRKLEKLPTTSKL